MNVAMDAKYIIKLTATLCATCVVVAAALGLVNHITLDSITQANNEKTNEALTAVFQSAAAPKFSELDVTDAMTEAASSYGATIENVYEVTDGGGAVGHAVKIAAPGSQETIEMVVGVDIGGAVTGVSVVTHAETSGIGSKVMDNEPLDNGTPVLDQFIGKSAVGGALTVGSNVDAIAGATVSSRGVTVGVNGALAAVGTIG